MASAGAPEKSHNLKGRSAPFDGGDQAHDMRQGNGQVQDERMRALPLDRKDESDCPEGVATAGTGTGSAASA